MKDRIRSRVMQRVVISILVLVGIGVAQTNWIAPKAARMSACAEHMKGVASRAIIQRRKTGKLVLKRNKVMDKNQMTPEELLKRVRTLKELGFVQGEIPEDGPEAEAYAKLLYQEWTNREGDLSKSFPEGSKAGRLMIFVRQDRAAWDNKTDHYLNDLDGSEWIAVFRDVLKCPMGMDESFTASDNLNEWHERVRSKFQQAIPDYPMLGRIWDTYNDVTYKPEEIEQLRDECLRVQASTSNEKALAGLAKLLSACDEASKLGSGLLLACD